MRLEIITEGLWGAESTVRFLGQRVPTRMTVFDLNQQGLLVHSPIEPAARLRSQIDSLGTVRFLVAPSTYHHLWFGDWAKTYPVARTYAAPGLPEKRPDLSFDETLGDEPSEPWSSELDQLVLRGLPIFNEVVFLHRKTRTLIVSDLAFNIYEADGLLAPLVMRLNGMWKRFGPSRALALMMRRNRLAATEDIRRILEWDFDRIVVGHGEVLTTGGREQMREAFAFLL